MRKVSIDQIQHIGDALRSRMRQIMQDVVRLKIFIQYRLKCAGSYCAGQ